MNSSAPDYERLYRDQDSVLDLLAPALNGFYLTGGTALGRFYLGHRYSDDLDFFVNSDPAFREKTEAIFELLKGHYRIGEAATVKADSFVRIWLAGDAELKLEFVNDTASRWGETVLSGNVPLDNIANILANKLTAILSRDEPKDIFDILCISEFYSFNWQQVYRKVFEKHITNESDIGMRLGTFPVELLSGQPWLKSPPDMKQMKTMLETITDDFLFARDNSLGASKTALIEARPGEPHPRPFS